MTDWEDLLHPSMILLEIGINCFRLEFPSDFEARLSSPSNPRYKAAGANEQSKGKYQRLKSELCATLNEETDCSESIVVGAPNMQRS